MKDCDLYYQIIKIFNKIYSHDPLIRYKYSIFKIKKSYIYLKEKNLVISNNKRTSQVRGPKLGIALGRLRQVSSWVWGTLIYIKQFRVILYHSSGAFPKTKTNNKTKNSASAFRVWWGLGALISPTQPLLHKAVNACCIDLLNVLWSNSNFWMVSAVYFLIWSEWDIDCSCTTSQELVSWD